MRYFLLSIIALMTLVACEDNDNESNVEPQKPQVEIQYSAEERQALIDLYNATNGPNCHEITLIGAQRSPYRNGRVCSVIVGVL